MNKQLFIMNNASNMLSKKYINGLILEINKLDIIKLKKEWWKWEKFPRKS